MTGMGLAPSSFLRSLPLVQEQVASLVQSSWSWLATTGSNHLGGAQVLPSSFTQAQSGRGRLFEQL